MRFESLTALQQAFVAARQILIGLATQWIDEQDLKEKIKSHFKTALQCEDAESLENVIKRSGLPMARRDEVEGELVRERYLPTIHKEDGRITRMLALVNLLHTLCQLEARCQALPQMPDTQYLDFVSKASKHVQKDFLLDPKPDLTDYQAREQRCEQDFQPAEQKLTQYIKEADQLVDQSIVIFRQLLNDWFQQCQFSHDLVLDERGVIRFLIQFAQPLPWHAAHQKMRHLLAGVNADDGTAVDELSRYFETDLRQQWNKQKESLLNQMSLARDQLSSTAKILQMSQTSLQTRAQVQRHRSVFDPMMRGVYGRGFGSSLILYHLLAQRRGEQGTSQLQWPDSSFQL